MDIWILQKIVLVDGRERPAEILGAFPTAIQALDNKDAAQAKDLFENVITNRYQIVKTFLYN